MLHQLTFLVHQNGEFDRDEWCNSEIVNVTLRSAEALMLYDLCCYVKWIIHPFDLFEQKLIVSIALNYFKLCGFSFHASCGPFGSPQWPVFTAVKEIHRNCVYHSHSIHMLSVFQTHWNISTLLWTKSIWYSSLRYLSLEINSVKLISVSGGKKKTWKGVNISYSYSSYFCFSAATSHSLKLENENINSMSGQWTALIQQFPFLSHTTTRLFGPVLSACSLVSDLTRFWSVVVSECHEISLDISDIFTSFPPSKNNQNLARLINSPGTGLSCDCISFICFIWALMCVKIGWVRTDVRDSAEISESLKPQGKGYLLALASFFRLAGLWRKQRGRLSPCSTTTALYHVKERPFYVYWYNV